MARKGPLEASSSCLERLESMELIYVNWRQKISRRDFTQMLAAEDQPGLCGKPDRENTSEERDQAHGGACQLGELRHCVVGQAVGQKFTCPCASVFCPLLLHPKGHHLLHSLSLRFLTDLCLLKGRRGSQKDRSGEATPEAFQPTE